MAAAKNNNYTLKRKINPQHTKEQIQAIIDDLLEWAHSGKGIWLASYIYERYKKTPAWLNNLGDHHPEVKEALAYAKELIGGKVANHCFEGDKNSAFGEKILPIYSTEYKALLKDKADMTKHSVEETTKYSLSDIKNMKADGTLDSLLTQPEKAPHE